MTPTLRVNPLVLHDVAAQERAVAAAVSSTPAGAVLAEAAPGMAGLRSADGCQSARMVLKLANESVSTALNGHAEKLDAAARQYDTTDTALGRRLQQFSR